MSASGLPPSTMPCLDSIRHRLPWAESLQIHKVNSSRTWHQKLGRLRVSAPRMHTLHLGFRYISHSGGGPLESLNQAWVLLRIWMPLSSWRHCNRCQISLNVSFVVMDGLPKMNHFSPIIPLSSSFHIWFLFVSSHITQEKSSTTFNHPCSTIFHVHKSPNFHKSDTPMKSFRCHSNSSYLFWLAHL